MQITEHIVRDTEIGIKVQRAFRILANQPDKVAQIAFPVVRSR